MADLINTAPRDIPTSSALPIAVLSVLAAMGTLATNILLPSLPQIAISLNVTTAEVTSAITVFLAVFGLGQLLVGPLSDRYGRRWPVLIGFAVFFVGSVWCGLATDLPNLLIGRVVQATGACATSVLSRAIARDMFSGAALARAMALIMIVMSAAPGFSPLLGGALDHSLGWRAEFALVAAFAAVSAVAYAIVLGETHNSIRTPFNPVVVGRTYAGLIRDRRFATPAAASSLTMGGLFSMFSACAAPIHRSVALHADPARALLCRHRLHRIRRGYACHKIGTTLRARWSDPGRFVRDDRQQPCDPAHLADQSDFLAVLSRNEHISPRHGHCRSIGHGARVVSIRRESRRGLGAAGFLADDDRGNRRMACCHSVT
ncbi:multidrug resistance protein [Bradyrhizobium sp. LM6.10]